MTATSRRFRTGAWPLRAATLSVLLLVLLTPAGGFGHIGGIIVRPTFFTPPPGITHIEGVVTVSWNDPDEDPTGVLHFYVTPHSLPPTGYLSTTFFEGAEKIGEYPVSDSVDGFDWDTSGFAPGVYSLYAVSVDPPLCNTVTTSPTTMVLRDLSGSSPAALAGAWVAPGSSFSGSIAGKTTLRLTAESTTQPLVTVEVGRIEPVVEGPPDAECSALGVFNPKATIIDALEGEPDPEGGSDRWSFSALWDSDAMLPGLHVFRATFSNTAGQSYTLFSPVEVPIAGTVPRSRDPELGPEAGPEPQGEVAGQPDAPAFDAKGSTDNGTTLITVTVPRDEGCALSSNMVDRTGRWGGGACVLFALWWVARRRGSASY